MVRLTAELILKSPSYWNPLKDREIDLRGNKIELIENLGATQDQFDTIDLSDNEIKRLENFPALMRLKTLFLCNNRISSIASLGEFLPNLNSLNLANNRLANLSDILPLADLPSLRYLSLLDNQITKKQHYRLYIIHKLPRLKLLDFRKIKATERAAAEKLFGPTALKIAKEKEKENTKSTKKPTKKEKKQASSKEAKRDEMQTTSTESHTISSKPEMEAIKKAITQASSLSEVEELAKSLASGQIPQTDKK
jgi:U2 small nuclear ribonucleoprotein A'